MPKVQASWKTGDPFAFQVFPAERRLPIEFPHIDRALCTEASRT
jgi:hypothetical protein